MNVHLVLWSVFGVVEERVGVTHSTTNRSDSSCLSPPYYYSNTPVSTMTTNLMHTILNTSHSIEHSTRVFSTLFQLDPNVLLTPGHTSLLPPPNLQIHLQIVHYSSIISNIMNQFRIIVILFSIVTVGKFGIFFKYDN